MQNINSIGELIDSKNEVIIDYVESRSLGELCSLLRLLDTTYISARLTFLSLDNEMYKAPDDKKQEYKSLIDDLVVKLNKIRYIYILVNEKITMRAI